MIMIHWYRKSTYFGRVLNFISTHPFQNEVAIIKNLIDGAVFLFHESFHSNNFSTFRKILVLIHFPQDLI